MAEKLNREQLSARLEISPARIQQLTATGVLTREGGGYDLLESTIALLTWYRRDEESKQAKLRLLKATAANHERRMRQRLRKLLTVDEMKEVLLGAFGDACTYIQAESSRAFSKLVADMGSEDKARLILFPVYEGARCIMLGYRNFVDALCEEIDRETLPDEKRLAEVMQELVTSATEPPDEVARPKRNVRARKARARRKAG